MNVFNILAEPLLAHGIFKRGPELEEYVKNLMDKCGLQAIIAIDIHTNSLVDKDKESGSRARWRSILALLFAMNLSALWTYRSSRRSST